MLELQSCKGAEPEWPLDTDYVCTIRSCKDSRYLRSNEHNCLVALAGFCLLLTAHCHHNDYNHQHAIRLAVEMGTQGHSPACQSAEPLNKRHQRTILPAELQKK